MHVPFCNYELHYLEYRDMQHNLQVESVAMLRPCLAGCATHRANEFEEQLGRLFPGMHLGFDVKKRRWVIYRWTTETETVNAGDDLPTIKHARRHMDIVIDCKWAVERRTPEGGRRMEFHPRQFGEWILRDLARYDPRRMTPDQSWVGDELDQRSRDNEEETQKKIRKNAEDMVADMMTLADRGNPWFRKKQFRQEKTVKEVAGAAT